MTNMIAPYSQEAEESVLGAVLIDPAAFAGCAQLLQAEDFYIRRHSLIWAIFDALDRQAQQIDFIAVQEALKADGKLNDIGGPAYLLHLVNACATSVNAEIYAGLVARAAERRRTLAALDKSRAIILDETTALEDAQRQIDGLILDAQRSSTSGFVTMERAVGEHFAQVEAALQNPRDLLGLPSALSTINHLLRGYRPGKLYIGGGRPGMGKSSMLITEAAQLAGQGYRIAFFTLEMPRDEVISNIVAAATTINADRLMSGQLSKGDWQRYVETAGKLGTLPLFIDDSAGITPLQVRQRCRRLRYEVGLDMVFVDYIQLMSGGNETRYDSRQQEIGYFSRSLKALAKELAVPIFAAAQLNRGVDERADKRPLLSDLRESGDLENDADVVMLYYRDDYYNPPVIPNVVSPLEIAIAKHRGGKTGMVRAGFRGELKQIVELARPMPA